jgi:uncharacterized membrane protein
MTTTENWIVIALYLQAYIAAENNPQNPYFVCCVLYKTSHSTSKLLALITLVVIVIIVVAIIIVIIKMRQRNSQRKGRKTGATASDVNNINRSPYSHTLPQDTD